MVSINEYVCKDIVHTYIVTLDYGWGVIRIIKGWIDRHDFKQENQIRNINK